MSQKSINSQTISKLFSSRKFILGLAKKRGFDTEDYESFSVNEIVIMYADKQLDMLLTNPTTKQRIYYKYHLGTKVRPPHVYDYIEDLFHVDEVLDKNDDLIIVGKDKLTDNLTNLIDIIFKKEGYYVNIYNYNNYLYNILDNRLVPPHRPLNDTEKEAVKKEYNILEESQFPEISRFDPVVLAIGLRPGQVVEIIRSSPTALTTKYYRLCK